MLGFTHFTPFLSHFKYRKQGDYLNQRDEFNKKCEDILSFLDIYTMMKFEYVEKFFPHSKKVINYLVKNQRVYKTPDGIYISTEKDTRPDKCLIASLGVLADIFEKVQSHTRATAPAQISFITYSGDYYEIVYVGYGMEAMVMASFETQSLAKQRSKVHENYTDTTKRIIIVEEKSQMMRLLIPRITRFALIQPNGSLSYFKGVD